MHIPSYGPPQPVGTNTSLRLYVAVVPDVLQAEDGNYDSAAESAKVITCQLYNTSYTADFRYVGGVQHVGLSTAGSYGYTGFSSSTAGVQQLSYVIDPGRSGDAYALTAYNVPLVRGFAYYAVFEAFNQVLIGSISTKRADGPVRLVIASGMVNSALFNTRELSFPIEWDYSRSLKSFADRGNAKCNGLSVAPLGNSTLSMKDTIQEMFRNATISLMSSEMLE